MSNKYRDKVTISLKKWLNKHSIILVINILLY